MSRPWLPVITFGLFGGILIMFNIGVMNHWDRNLVGNIIGNILLGIIFIWWVSITIRIHIEDKKKVDDEYLYHATAVVMLHNQGITSRDANYTAKLNRMIEHLKKEGQNA